MSKDDEVAFADHVGRWFAQQFGMAPITGRVLGWLMVCDPPAQTPAQLSAALSASRSSIGTAVAVLERLSYIQRYRPAGERVDRIRLDPEFGPRDLDAAQQYREHAAMTRQGLSALADTSPRRRARLLELAAFYDFLADRLPQVAAEWRSHRDALRASGELPTPD
ncbi:MarR family transcriptional regulator [Streptomonospora nanhaiensis]|uniref:DNA-binding MarR family transcriptional regulator n=1 Tax=Streptomonospora nanhaiensis TaxID=1323731 RepID=A0A853BU95_9ACTN|nr:MarR family transcriptional regulator [Streptomonospora nanhaiensis]MBV2366020.1 MarR family transcriptional regulator [Streptomonospora nanhaiensis]MBX9391223.1 MarR family transcriptional regulator [Streptomonospora nanhaiensis]NYI98336.1 DNA-binding MarR family transcriptional regulator [Streptomonospora nanhaiensis]